QRHRTGKFLFQYSVISVILRGISNTQKGYVYGTYDLNRRGIGFRSLTEQIDTTTASGKLIFHIFAALSEFERDIICQRTRAGLEAARKHVQWVNVSFQNLSLNNRERAVISLAVLSCDVNLAVVPKDYKHWFEFL
ncbi:MAG: recombinase family protein, partial [Rhodobacteraceae bacterium]|nr:recombinase family protein [Paracoccaceae bacterium]